MNIYFYLIKGPWRYRTTEGREHSPVKPTSSMKDPNTNFSHPQNNPFAHTYAYHHTCTHTHRGLLDNPFPVPERKSSFQIPYSNNWHSIQVQYLKTSPDRTEIVAKRVNLVSHVSLPWIFFFRIKMEQGLQKFFKNPQKHYSFIITRHSNAFVFTNKILDI